MKQWYRQKAQQPAANPQPHCDKAKSVSFFTGTPFSQTGAQVGVEALHNCIQKVSPKHDMTKVEQELTAFRPSFLQWHSCIQLISHISLRISQGGPATALLLAGKATEQHSV